MKALTGISNFKSLTTISEGAFLMHYIEQKNPSKEAILGIMSCEYLDMNHTLGVQNALERIERNFRIKDVLGLYLPTSKEATIQAMTDFYQFKNEVTVFYFNQKI